MSEELRSIATALTRVPDENEPEMGRMCTIITLICMAFQLRADSTGEGFEAYLVNVETNEAIAVDGIHVVWSARSLRHAIDIRETVISKYLGDANFMLTKRVTLRVLSETADPCSGCGTTYVSGLNRSRCEASHAIVPGKKRTAKKTGKEDRTPLPLEKFVASWDAMTTDERSVIASHGAVLLPGILGEYSSFSAPVRHMLAFAAGKTDIEGSQLALALDEASEGTFMFRPIRAVERTKLFTKTGYASGIAHVIITDVLTALSEKAAQQLIDDEDTMRHKSIQLKSKRNAARERQREEQRRTRIERAVWSLRPIPCWADADEWMA